MRFKDWLTEQDVGPGESELEKAVQKTTQDAVDKLGTTSEVNPKDEIKATFTQELKDTPPEETGQAIGVLSGIVGDDKMKSRKKSKKNSKKKSKKK